MKIIIKLYLCCMDKRRGYLPGGVSKMARNMTTAQGASLMISFLCELFFVLTLDLLTEFSCSSGGNAQCPFSSFSSTSINSPLSFWVRSLSAMAHISYLLIYSRGGIRLTKPQQVCHLEYTISRVYRRGVRGENLVAGRAACLKAAFV